VRAAEMVAVITAAPLLESMDRVQVVR